jgi:hypothetical protein
VSGSADTLLAELVAVRLRAEQAEADLVRVNDLHGEQNVRLMRERDEAEARAEQAEAALKPFLTLVETFAPALIFDGGEGLALLSDAAWMNLRGDVHKACVAAAAVLAAGGTPP